MTTIPAKTVRAAAPWAILQSLGPDAGALLSIVQLHGTAGWEAWWSAVGILSVVVSHGVARALGRPGGGVAGIVAAAILGGVWVATKAPVLAALAARLGMRVS